MWQLFMIYYYLFEANACFFYIYYYLCQFTSARIFHSAQDNRMGLGMVFFFSWAPSTPTMRSICFFCFARVTRDGWDRIECSCLSTSRCRLKHDHLCRIGNYCIEGIIRCVNQEENLWVRWVGWAKTSRCLTNPMNTWWMRERVWMCLFGNCN